MWDCSFTALVRKRQQQKNEKSYAPEHLISGAVKDSHCHCRHMMFCLFPKQFNSSYGLVYVILFKLLVMLVHWRLCSPSVPLRTSVALCWPHWGSVTDVPASSSGMWNASWVCFRPVLWVAASWMDCLDMCSSLSPGCTQFTVPGTVLSAHGSAHYIWTQWNCAPLVKQLPALGLVVGPVSAILWSLFLFLWLLVFPETCHFQKLMGRGEAVRGIFWRRKESCWDWWTFS